MRFFQRAIATMNKRIFMLFTHSPSRLSRKRQVVPEETIIIDQRRCKGDVYSSFYKSFISSRPSKWSPLMLKEGEEDGEDIQRQDKAIFLFFRVYPVLQVDADASNLSFGSVQDDADTSNISFGTICVRQVYAIELSIDYADYYYVLKAKSRVLTILLTKVSSYCLKRYCAGMSLAAPREEAE